MKVYLKLCLMILSLNLVPHAVSMEKGAHEEPAPPCYYDLPIEVIAEILLPYVFMHDNVGYGEDILEGWELVKTYVKTSLKNLSLVNRRFASLKEKLMSEKPRYLAFYRRLLANRYLEYKCIDNREGLYPKRNNVWFPFQSDDVKKMTKFSALNKAMSSVALTGKCKWDDMSAIMTFFKNSDNQDDSTLICHKMISLILLYATKYMRHTQAIAFDIAAENHMWPICILLLRNRFLIDPCHLTHAIRKKYPIEVTKYILSCLAPLWKHESKMNFAIPSPFSSPYLDIAIEMKSSVKMFNLLLAHGASVSAIPPSKTSPLRELIRTTPSDEKSQEETIYKLKLLLLYGADNNDCKEALLDHIYHSHRSDLHLLERTLKLLLSVPGIERKIGKHILSGPRDLALSTVRTDAREMIYNLFSTYFVVLPLQVLCLRYIMQCDEVDKIALAEFIGPIKSSMYPEY